MNEIGDHVLFFVFFISPSYKRTKQKSPNTKIGGNFSGKFLKYWKKRNTLAIKISEKKGGLLTELTF
jgi:hypothetical protein